MSSGAVDLFVFTLPLNFSAWIIFRGEMPPELWNSWSWFIDSLISLETESFIKVVLPPRVILRFFLGLGELSILELTIYTTLIGKTGRWPWVPTPALLYYKELFAFLNSVYCYFPTCWFFRVIIYLMKNWELGICSKSLWIGERDILNGLSLWLYSSIRFCISISSS